MENSQVDLYSKGMNAYEQGDRKTALECFAKVVMMGDTESQCYKSAKFNVACNLIDLGHKEEGMKIMKECAQDDHPTALYYMGVDFERNGDCRALTCYVRASLLGCMQAVNAIKDLDVELILENRTLENSVVLW